MDYDGSDREDSQSGGQTSWSVWSRADALALVSTSYTENYERLVRTVRGRFPNLDGENVVQDLFNKILDGLDSCGDTSAELTTYVHQRTQRAYQARAVNNACLDLIDSVNEKREKLVTWDADGSDGAAFEPRQDGDLGETVTDKLDELRWQTAARTMLRVLYERGKRPQKKQPYVTDRQFQTLAAIYDPDLAPVGTPLTSDEVQDEAVKSNKRARARWDRQHGRSSPEAGAQARAAAQMGVSRAAVSKSHQAVNASMQLVHYVAGVLAPAGTLLHPIVVHQHVDAFESLDERTDNADYAQRLMSAAEAVGTTTATGTRVQPLQLRNPARLSLTELVADLHDAEQGLAELTATPEPNCVTVCEQHTHRPYRVTEVYL